MVEIFLLGPDGRYGRPGIYCETDTVKANVLKNLEIDLSPVFSIEIG
jgi:hypothetical protein